MGKLGEAPAEILYALVGEENGKAHLDLERHGSQKEATPRGRRLWPTVAKDVNNIISGCLRPGAELCAVDALQTESAACKLCQVMPSYVGGSTFGAREAFVDCEAVLTRHIQTLCFKILEQHRI